MKLCIATENSGKMEEFRSILNQTPFEVVSARGMGVHLDVEESGSTYKENAGLKAHAYANATGLPALADDTGLEVQALLGAPGLYSKRYLPEGKATDADRRAFLLSNLQPFPRPWKARFTCVVCVALPDGSEWFTSGECKGEIIPVESGDYGFGYDRIFQLSGMEKTMADLTLLEKNTLSHRGKAVKAAIPILMRLAAQS